MKQGLYISITFVNNVHISSY